MILEKSKKAIGDKNSLLHTGHMFMHALMQNGTSSDIFLRQNLEWMGKSVNWAKFSATASLGVIHKGHIKQSKNLLSTYLPRDDGGGNLYNSNFELIRKSALKFFSLFCFFILI